MNKIEAELSNEAIARSDENFGVISIQKVEENVEVSQNGTEKVAKVKKLTQKKCSIHDLH